MPAITRQACGRCRPAVAANPVPNSAISAVVDTRPVSAMASPVVATAMPSRSSVLAFTAVPAADPNGAM